MFDEIIVSDTKVGKICTLLTAMAFLRNHRVIFLSFILYIALTRLEKCLVLTHFQTSYDLIKKLHVDTS